MLRITAVNTETQGSPPSGSVLDGWPVHLQLNH